MSKKVTVIDYGMGNLFSVCRAIESQGGEPIITADAQAILSAERLILPGVGAFENGMNELKQRNLVDPVREFAKNGRPFLGICLGMQMMLDVSEEFGNHEGLGLIPGKVSLISKLSKNGGAMKVPHIGWNGLKPCPRGAPWKDSILNQVEVGASVYFVHSFAAFPKDPAHYLAAVDYGGHDITAAIASRNIYGCQFHPERSGEIGLKIMQKFLALK